MADSNTNFDWQEKIVADLESSGIHHYGFTTISSPATIQFYRQWLENGYDAEMKYLRDHLPLKESPNKLYTKAKSAICIGASYMPSVPGGPTFPLKASRVSLYARGNDYHLWLKQKLNELTQNWEAEINGAEFVNFVDSSPVLERDLAQKAGLGWFGKNTCLIDRNRGSLFFLAEIFTNLNLQPSDPMRTDHCGTCTRCIDACPTDAIVDDHTLDANRCISYLTIEKKGSPPMELREKIGDWFFGCDICQTVCPWNQKAFNLESEINSKPDRSTLITELREILTSSNKALIKKFAGTPLSRAGGKGLKRNAMVVATNEKLEELLPEIKKYRDHQHLGELSLWASEQLETH